jgi:hypothetical protein
MLAIVDWVRVDNRNMDDIRDLIKPFGRLICWQKDDILARIIIKAKVTDLADVPHYIILSEGDDHEGISLTVHCEIVQQVMIGGQLQDEDIPPGGFDDNDFVYLGFEGNWIQNFHEQHFPENRQNNPLPIPEVPDLNDPVQEEMLEQQQNPEEQVPTKEEMSNHEPQHELDLHLNLSAPIPSSALSRIGQDSLSGSVQMAEDQHPSLQHPVIELGIQAPLGGFQLDLNDIGHPLEADLPVAEDAQLGHHEEQEQDVGHIDQIVEQGILDAEEGVVGDDNQAGYMDIDLPELLPALQNPDISANLGTFNMNLNINMAITQFDVPGKAAPNGLTFMERKMGQHNSKTPRMYSGFGPNSSPQWAVLHRW